MTEDQTVTPEIQAAINSLYQSGFEVGRVQGYAEGIAAAREHLTKLANTLPELISPQLQEANASMPLSTPIEDLDFTVRSYNCLKREGLHTIGDILVRSDAQLDKLRNFGSKSVEEVRGRMKSIGYTLREDPDYQQ